MKAPRKPHDTWPPLIVASEKPRWVTWRDFGLTLLMWIMFAIMLETEFELFFGRYLERLGLGDFNTDAHWDVFLHRLRPYIGLVMILLVSLVGTTLATLQRVRRALKLQPPPPLALIDEAPHAKMTPEALLAARGLRVAVVHVEPDGTHRVEARA
jgi:hypothetical protein